MAGLGRRVGFFLLIIGFVGCGASRPGPKTSLATLKAKVNIRDGDLFTRCTNNDRDACAWVAAYWKADRDAAEADCRAGRAGRCMDAAFWYEGTEINAGATPRWAGHLPPDPPRRAEALARACELATPTNKEPDFAPLIEGLDGNLDSSFMGRYCADAGEAFADSDGVAPDFARAEKYLRKACEQRLSLPCDPKTRASRRDSLFASHRDECEHVGPGCDLTDGPTSYLQQRIRETPDQRAQRVAGAAQQRQEVIDGNRKERAQTERENREYAQAHAGDSAQAMAAGFQAGMQTVNATNQSLATAQANINQMTAQRTPAPPPPPPAPPATANAAQATQSTVLPNQPIVKPVLTPADRKHNLEACLATDKNCEYGTSTACQPSVAYGDAFGHRHVLTRAAQWVQQCNKPWPQCKSDALMLAGDQGTLEGLARRVDDVLRRKLALPPAAANSCPASSANSEDVRKVRFWCDNAQKDCAPALNAAAAALENARAIEACLHSVEFQVRRNEQKAQHDLECHRTWD